MFDRKMNENLMIPNGPQSDIFFKIEPLISSNGLI